MAKSKKKEIVRRPAIQIPNPDEKLFEVVQRLAKEERRTMGRQAEYMLLKYIELKKL